MFSKEGFGTVVTGIPLSGTVRPGTELEILPLGTKIKVRGIHAYGGKVEEAVAGHSTALSVPDAKESGVHRGMVCAEPGIFGNGDAVDVDLTLTPRSPKLTHRVPIRFHTGTVEVRGQLLLLDRDEAVAEQQFVARLELDERVACHPTDRFLLRLQNPAVTVGGGRVLRLEDSGRYRRKALGAELQGIVDAGDKPEARVVHELEQAGPAGCTIDDLSRALSVEDGKVLELCESLAEVEVHEKAMRVFLRDQVVVGERELVESVDRMLARRPAAASIKRASIRTTRSLPQQMIDLVFEKMQAAGKVRAGRQGQILFLDRLKPLPPEDQARFDKILAECETRGFRPPRAEELAAASGVSGDALMSLIDRAQDEGLIDAMRWSSGPESREQRQSSSCRYWPWRLYSARSVPRARADESSLVC